MYAAKLDTGLLRCPVCGGAFDFEGQVARCAQGHTFNRAREGYLNLLKTSRPGDSTGDPKAAARSRRDFLDKGYYQPLRDAMVQRVSAFVKDAGQGNDGQQRAVSLLDVCCGEGYYTSSFAKVPGLVAYGFDLAKEMVRLAAKRGGATYFVANMTAIPVADRSFDLVTHLFAPFSEHELARVLRKGGRVLTVVPGRRHLFGLKEVLYDTPYPNDEKLPRTTELEFVGRTKVSAEIELACQEDIEAVFRMTPYYYRTRPADRERLAGLSSLETPIEFVIGEYRKASTASRPQVRTPAAGRQQAANRRPAADEGASRK